MPESQNSLFGSTQDKTVHSITLEKAPPATPEERLSWEKEFLGLYISGHPLDAFREKLKNKQTLDIASIKKNMPAGATIVIVGMVSRLKEFFTKKGDAMAFLEISDYGESIEAVVFPKTLLELKSILVPESCVVVKGKLSERNGQKSIVIDKAKMLI